MSNTPEVKNTVEASQGKSGMGVRYVLIGGLVLVIVAFALVYAFA